MNQLKINFKKCFLFFFYLVVILSFSFSDGIVDKEKSEKNDIVSEYSYYIDSSNRLHIHSYKDENLEILLLNQNNYKKGKTVTFVSNDKLYRFFYNDKLVLNLIEKWNVGKTSAETFLERIILYKEELLENEFKVKIEYDLINYKSIETVYNKNNLINSKTHFLYLIPSTQTKNNISYDKLKSYKSRVESKIQIKYDSENRVIEEQEIVFKYANPDSLSASKIINKKNLYQYEKVGVPATLLYYEDNMLRMKTVYTEYNSYIQEIYFDIDSYIKITYDKGKKKNESLFINKILEDSKDYD